MFNVYYPKLLETGSREDSTPASLEGNLWDVVIFTLGGCPGALVRRRLLFVLRARLIDARTQVGAYMVESPLGRRRSLAGTTLLTAFFCMAFVLVDHPFWVRVSSVGISLSATVSCDSTRFS